MTNRAAMERPVGFEEAHSPLTPDQALIESERCLTCGGPLGIAPCVEACPTRIDVPRFISEIRDGRPVEAAATIFASNALGGTCARVCPTSELCEASCVLHDEGRRPVEIGRLQRYATDVGFEALRHRTKTVPHRSHTQSVAVIGAGPAGLACAEELACLGYGVTVFEANALPGGLVTYAIAPYKQMIDPIIDESARIAGLGVDIRYGVEIGVDVQFETLLTEYSAVFLGAGMGADLKAGLPGEDLPGVYKSLDLIGRIKTNPSSLPKLRRKVAVIGGGNTAIDVVRELIRLQVEEVTLVYRRDESSMPAFKHEVEAARSEGVQFCFLAAPIRILGEDEVTGIECIHMQLGEPDAKGRPRPVPIEGSEFVLDVDAVVTAIGQGTRHNLLDGLGVATRGSTVPVNETFQTNVPMVFAGGDCVTGGTTVVESVRHGKLAARGIHSYLSGEPYTLPEPERRAKTRSIQDGPFDKRYQGKFYIGSSTTLCKGCNLCVNSCPSDILFLDAKGKIQMSDISKCVFCGICEMRCPDFAIWMSKDEHQHHPIEVEARRRLTL